MPRPLSLACCGCGARAQTYMQLAALRPDRLRVVAGADPVAERVEKVRRLSAAAEFRGFADADALLAAGRLADVLVVATQDNCALRPVLPCPGDGLRRPAGEADRHAARGSAAHRTPRPPPGTPRHGLFRVAVRRIYGKVKEIVDSGLLGEIVSIQASEGVRPLAPGPFVRARPLGQHGQELAHAAVEVLPRR